MTINHRKRIVVCRGVYCNESRRADKNLAQLQPLVDALNAGEYPPPIKIETATCLSMCGAGPNLIIYPGQVICNGVDNHQILRIVEEYLKGTKS